MNRKEHIESLIKNKWNICVVGYSHIRSTGTDYYFIDIQRKFSLEPERISIEKDDVDYYSKLIKDANIKRASELAVKKADDTKKRKVREARKMEMRGKIMDSIKSLVVDEVEDEDQGDEEAGIEDS